MQCPFCQSEMGDAQNACPRCGRPHSPYVAYYLAKGWNDLQRNVEPEARAAFTEALRVTPPNDKPQLQSYIAYLVQQTAGSRMSALREQAPVVAAALSAAGVPVPSASRPQAAKPPQAATADAPAPRVQAGKLEAGSRGLFFNFNEKPANIVRVMDQAKRQRMEAARARSQRIWFVPLALVAGLPFVYLDGLIGYNYLTFSLVAYVLWVAAIAGFVLLMRDRSLEFKTDLDTRPARPGSCFTTVFLIVFFGIWAVALGSMAITFLATISFAVLATAIVLIAALVSFFVLRSRRPTGKEFGPKFDAARTIFETIKDDVSPKRTLMGWLDLTGPQPGKAIRQRTSLSGMPVNYYRDEWLKMKLVLYDGNVMRVTGLERIKARMGRWKRKGRWKPGSSASRNELRVAVTVNREAYDVQPVQTGQAGKFLIDGRESGDGRVVLTAVTDAPINEADILWVLRLAYYYLKPRQAAA
jgi:hypothetical protein